MGKKYKRGGGLGQMEAKKNCGKGEKREWNCKETTWSLWSLYENVSLGLL